MKFVVAHKGDRVEKIACYTNSEKKSHHMGDIVLLSSIGWGFMACGVEQFITSKELEQIRVRIDVLNGN